jgi:SAM-dependent methyltransferase
VAPLADLLAEAATHPTSGWDFSWLGDRMSMSGVPWDYRAIAEAAILEGGGARATRMLDMGTGGGERLAEMKSLPGRAVATEGWAPNVPVAAARLAPLGIPVVHDEGAIDNVDQTDRPPRGRLAFRDAAFDLVINRHEAFVAAEVYRVLEPGGRFVTQQADSAGGDAGEVLGLAPPPGRLFDRSFATAQLDAAGFVVDAGADAIETITFSDVGAFAWYLRMIPWAVPGFTIDAHRTALERLHRSGEPIVVRGLRFWLRAMKGRRA